MSDGAVTRTFSLVALDPKTGYLGSAVASKYPGVGSVVLHLRQGVGAFNTQHDHFHKLAEQGLALMAAGADPQAAIKMVLAGDEHPEQRQLLAIDIQGRKGVWSGEKCYPVAHHVIGKNCVAAGNTLASKAVIEAMVAAMDAASDEPFGMRLIRALEAGEKEGGDSRGKQAAAVRVIPVSLDVQQSDYVDWRVDDHADPIAELYRLYKIAPWKVPR